MSNVTEYSQPSRKMDLPLGGILLRSAFVLMCLFVLSVHLMGGLFARYSTSGTGSDGARVAAFDVNVVGEARNTTITASQDPVTGAYTFKVTNDSEVAVCYDVVISYTDPISGVHVVLDGKDTRAVKDGSSTFTNVGTLAPGVTSADHEISFVVDWNAVTAGMSGSSATLDLEFAVTVIVQQMD